VPRVTFAGDYYQVRGFRLGVELGGCRRRSRRPSGRPSSGRYDAPSEVALTFGALAPGSQVTSDADLRKYVMLATGSFSHLVGTCTIGTGERAVLDPQLRVRGIAALRVADASVMPSVVAAYTNATVLAIAERAASILIDG